MTPSKLTDAVERGIAEFDERFPTINPADSKKEDRFHVFLRTFARDLILAVEESVPKKFILGEDFVGAEYLKGHNACRGKILRSLDAFLGDNK